ncbi:MAG TPA: hypothetical protein VFH15_06670 [Pyrinomonadaceae bacterium]|nr:hypothetical protein [Pyrinomonadaceae bacterium]
MRAEQLQSWVLRLTGATEILAFISVVMPRSWMEASHSWLGLGAMPEGPIIMFMIRQASYAYGMHGVSLWLMATDVRRYQPLIVFNAISFLIAGVVFSLIDYIEGMPLWWTIVDGFGCASFGAAVLILNSRMRGSLNQ